MKKKTVWFYVKEELQFGSITINKNEVGELIREPHELEDHLIIRFLSQDEECMVEERLLVEFDPLETGDGFEQKICNECHTIKDTEENFSSNQTGKDNRIVRRPSCKDCRVIIDGRRIRNKNKKAEKPDGQRFNCPICDRRGIVGTTIKIVLDHDHVTGKPRGYICNGCNTALGAFRDNYDLLIKAAQYINP